MGQGQNTTNWTALTVPNAGRPGFTLMPPEQTGVRFTNVLDEWSSAANRVLENGSGVAIGDFDRDGRPDIFLCSLTGRNALYRNLGAWRFENVTERAGMSATNHVCRGAVFADVNGDGWPDLLISTLGHGVRCFMNNGRGQFTDATAAAKTETQFGSMTLALADVDGNGTLDLYVTNYRTDDIRDRSRVEIQRVNGRVVPAPWLRDRLMITEQGLLEFGEPDVLYLNDGQGRFTPVPWTGGQFLDEAGKALAAAPLDWGLAAAFRDLNGDGFPDFYVCNDYWTPDRIWLNDGHGKFQALPRLAVRHTSENSMGVDFADIDRDGHLDFFVLDMLSRDLSQRRRRALAQTKIPDVIGEISNRPQVMRNTLFHNRGDGTFEEIADFAGVFASEWSWQPVFIDVDLDGFEDLIVSAGHSRDVQDLDATAAIQARQHPWPRTIDPNALQRAFTQEMMEHARLYPPSPAPIVAFRNLGDLKFADMTSQWGTSHAGVHQGIAFADLDGDGDLDFVVNNLNGVCGLYRNDSAAPRVAARLRGLPPNTQGIGAKITLQGGAVPQQSQELICGGRYLSGDDPMRVFAAGSLTNEMRLEVVWRSGRRSVVTGVKANRIYAVDEASANDQQSPGGSGPSSVVRGQGPGGAKPNYELRITNYASPPPNRPAPLFEDVSERLSHLHHEEPFDDFQRQPLLPRKLSQLGPGVCWFDCDGDGREDLIIGSGKGGVLAIFRNDGRGGFGRQALFEQPLPRDQTGVVAWTRESGQTVILSGLASYEDGDASQPSIRQFDFSARQASDLVAGFSGSAGPLALADADGDGDLDLFVGGRVIPGRYPEPADSRLYRNEGGRLVLDEINSKTLEKAGLVSSAVWSDLDGDGFPELIVACEWGPIRIFRNSHGTLNPWDPPLVEANDSTVDEGPKTKDQGPKTEGHGPRTTDHGRRTTFSQLTGWWTGVTTDDLDDDGRLDIIAANWGLNTPYQAAPEQPLRLLWGNLSGTGADDLIETEYDPNLRDWAPRRNFDELRSVLPFLSERFHSHREFSQASARQVLGDRWGKAAEVRVTTLASMVFFNRGDHFDAKELPRAAQFAPIFAVNAADFDGDSHEDIFLSQNFFANRPGAPRSDAGRGLLLRGDGAGNLNAMTGAESGLRIYGEQRGAGVCDYDGDGGVDLVVTQNGAATKLYRNAGGKAGLRIRLAGPAGNRSGIGAVLRLRFDDRNGPAREIHAGSGYWSQDSAVAVLGIPQPPTRLEILWPGGQRRTVPVPGNAREITVNKEGEVRTVR